ncbi:MAG: signal recognition particle protein [Planctomycetaceae bacterium]|jgi:signal recognition particle subunit SRP54|nr:signal recognition particle protein [Planctomycetaceae bacterium]
MFETLQDSLMSAIRTLRGRGKLTESNMREGLDLVRQSLLEADVSFPVVKDFIAKISERALGESVRKLLDPTEQLVKIVHEELIQLMGPVDHDLHLRKPFATFMLCGLQGSGKTTTCGKLGKLLVKRDLKPMLVAADLQRPAAIDQLEILGQSIGVPVHVDRESKNPVKVCQDAARKAASLGVDVLILDTAGRLHIDEELMEQLRQIEQELQPDQVYFVVDAMTGQDAVNSAKAFNEALELDGVILTKLDGDTRGGAALSVKHITGVPIKFVGTGESVESLEEFYPNRMAGRILGMGDMLTLIEQATEQLDKETIEKQQERLAKGEFTLDDFRSQMGQAKRLGSFGKLLGFIPGMGEITSMMGKMNVDADDELKRVGGIIDSMTPDEKQNPKIIDNSRRHRIAAGAGVEPQQVSDLIKSFLPMAEMMKSMSSMNGRDRMAVLQQMTKSFGKNPINGVTPPKKGTGKRLTSQEKNEARKKREKEKKKREKEKAREKYKK